MDRKNSGTADQANDQTKWVTDFCPVNDSSRHTYFIYKTFEVYEPVDTDLLVTPLGQAVDSQLYARKEYAISGCKCGDVIKVDIRNAPYD